MVDDMIFFRDCNLLNCMLVLEESQSSYSLHLKLTPNICYSHTNNKLITLPKFEPAESIKTTNQADVAQVVTQHSSMGYQRMDDGDSMGSGLLGAAASSSMAGSSFGRSSGLASSLSGYVDRDSERQAP